MSGREPPMQIKLVLGDAIASVRRSDRRVVSPIWFESPKRTTKVATPFGAVFTENSAIANNAPTQAASTTPTINIAATTARIERVIRNRSGGVLSAVRVTR